MKTSELDILIVPGWTNAQPDHWQSRWERNLKTARRIEQADWETPRLTDWVARIVETVHATTRPCVIVAHGCGVIAVATAAPQLAHTSLKGLFLVAPVDLAGHEIWPATDGGFAALPMQRLPVVAKVVGSSTDPYCSVEQTQAIGAIWGADVSIIANAGHLNIASGHGPWPEGVLTFGLFLKKLG